VKKTGTFGAEKCNVWGMKIDVRECTLFEIARRSSSIPGSLVWQPL
jgi:hypothetical protein